MHGLDVRGLQVFVTVAEAGGMTAAAAQLGMSQSAVSQKLSGLEQALGAALFDRTVRPVALSVAGQVLLERARGLLAQVAETERAVREAANLGLPQLRLALVDSAAATIGPLLVGELRGLARTLQVRSGLAPTHMEELVGREVDLILTPLPEVEGRSDFRSVTMVTEPYVLVVPPTHEGPVPSLAALAGGMELVRYTGRSVIGQHVEQHLRRLRLAPERHLEFDTTDAVLAMVGAGVGWALTTPLCLLQVPTWAAGVRCLPLPGPGFTRTLRLIGRGGELGGVFDRVAEAGQEVLRRHCLPAIARLAPGLADGIVVGEG